MLSTAGHILSQLGHSPEHHNYADTDQPQPSFGSSGASSNNPGEAEHAGHERPSVAAAAQDSDAAVRDVESGVATATETGFAEADAMHSSQQPAQHAQQAQQEQQPQEGAAGICAA